MPNKLRLFYSRIIVTALGVGNSPILPGTLGSLVGLLLYLFVSSSFTGYGMAVVLLAGAGIWSCRIVLRETRDADPPWIVVVYSAAPLPR